ncbi:alanine--glyoxylate aminotransferase family protein [SAR202 cluster bacterium AD-802-E10_MRT_200m]|nr:alanine--glyoxylate aminotransferase family protein [SAR202 cluster bacterium AD-802-E10_MRT_200m]MQF82591.1 alanine--glyoxylate aminotransferase family protein [SAR202 cluster bacterium AD-802-E10_MRT_200m]
MVNLRVPGPTPCPTEVLEAGSKQMINHRGPEFAGLIGRIHSGLQQIFQTKNDVILLTGSGTSAMEAAIVNTLSPQDKVLGISVGVFGDRFCQIFEAYGIELIKPQFEAGVAADPELINETLRNNPDIKAVAITHNETSTGVTNDLETIANIVKSYDKLLLVDAVSSLGCLPLNVDAWGCDVVVTASQKGFMVPPGLAFASVSQRAWDASKTAKLPRFYLDFGRHKSYFERGQTPWTPAVSVMFGLDKALEMMLEEGVGAIHERHASVGQRVRDGIESLGLKLFPKDPQSASNTVTAIHSPEGLDTKALLTELRTEHDVVLAAGQGYLEGKMFRVGHLGYVTEKDIDDVLDSLKVALPKFGVLN